MINVSGKFVVRVLSIHVESYPGCEGWRIVTCIALTSSLDDYPAGTIFGWLSRRMVGDGFAEPLPPFMRPNAVIGLQTENIVTKSGKPFTRHHWMPTCPVHEDCATTLEVGCACLEATRGEEYARMVQEPDYSASLEYINSK